MLAWHASTRGDPAAVSAHVKCDVRDPLNELGRVATASGLLITQRSRVQIPPPLLISAGQGPFPIRKRAWHFRRVAKYVAATRFRAPRQRDGGDGVLRDETAWTWWTLPPAISGCLAQRYRTGHRPLGRAAPVRTRGAGDGVTSGPAIQAPSPLFQSAGPRRHPRRPG
jgi:hypothetical protein